MGTESIEQESKTSKTVKSIKSTTKSNHLQDNVLPPPPATQVTPIAVTPYVQTAPPPPYTPPEYRTLEPAALKSTQNQQNQEKFNHNDPKYKCCCMHCKTATLTVGIIECALITLLAIGLLIIGFHVAYAWNTIGIILIVNAFIYVPVFISFFVGYCKKTWQLFIPYFVMAFFRIMGTTLCIGILIYVTISQYVVGAVLVILSCSWLILQIWWICTVNKYVKYCIAYKNSLNGVVYNNGEEEEHVVRRSYNNTGY